MADDSSARKKYKAKYFDPLNAQRTESATNKVSAQRRELWHALNAFIISHGGAVTSVPEGRVLRVEIPKDSTLPIKLAELGYDPLQCGATTRITSKGFKAMDVIEISLPGK